SLAAMPISIMLTMTGGVGDGRGATGDEQTALLRQIHEHTLLSDKAKRLVYRSKELQLLRSAIEADIGQGDYDAALTLCTEMAEDFGFREEAEGFRQTIEHVRREAYEGQLHEAMHALDERLQARD